MWDKLTKMKLNGGKVTLTDIHGKQLSTTATSNIVKDEGRLYFMTVDISSHNVCFVQDRWSFEFNQDGAITLKMPEGEHTGGYFQLHSVTIQPPSTDS